MNLYSIEQCFCFSGNIGQVIPKVIGFTIKQKNYTIRVSKKDFHFNFENKSTGVGRVTGSDVRKIKILILVLKTKNTAVERIIGSDVCGCNCNSGVSRKVRWVGCQQSVRLNVHPLFQSMSRGLSSSASYLAKISVRSPRKSFIFII